MPWLDRRHGGVKVSVLVDGAPLPEHAVVSVDEYTVECYIASESGKMFEIEVFYNGSENDTAFKAYVDGVGDGGYHPVGFTELAVTDDDNALQSADCNWDDIGTIEVKSFLTRPKEYNWRPQRQRQYTEPQLGTAPIHEFSKKAGSHRAFLGEFVREAPRPMFNNNRPQSTFAEYNGTIKFLYRPRAFLQAQGIIPRRASPEPIVIRPESQPPQFDAAASDPQFIPSQSWLAARGLSHGASDVAPLAERQRAYPPLPPLEEMGLPEPMSISERPFSSTGDRYAVASDRSFSNIGDRYAMTSSTSSNDEIARLEAQIAELRAEADRRRAQLPSQYVKRELSPISVRHEGAGRIFIDLTLDDD